MNPFHLAIPVSDLEATKTFYSAVCGAGIGRETKAWVDFNFFGHQLSAHLAPDAAAPTAKNGVDGKKVPVRHFGIVLDWQAWHDFADRLKSQNIRFIIEPYIRFKGQAGEQATMFFQDPSGNALEFKAFKDRDQLFAS